MRGATAAIGLLSVLASMTPHNSVVTPGASAGQIQETVQPDRVRQEADTAWNEGQRLRAEWWMSDGAERAARQYERAAALSRSIDDRRGEARAAHGLCALHLNLAEYQSALTSCGQALALARSTDDRGREAGVLLSLCTIHYRSGDVASMLALARHALPLMRAERDRAGEGAVLVRIGQALALEGWTGPATTHFVDALGIYRELKDPAGEALALTLLGRMEDARGNHASAIVRHREALAVAEAAGDAQRQGVALDNLGASHAARGEDVEARAAYERSEAIFRSRSDKARQAEPLFHLAEIDRQRGHLAAARLHIEEAIAIVESLRRSLTADDLRGSVQASKRDFYGSYVDILLGQHQREPGAGHDRRAFEISERARARSLLDLLAEGRVDIRRNLPADLKTREQQIDDTLTRVQRRLLAARGARAAPVQIALIDRELEAAEQARRALEWDIRGLDREYAAVAYPEPLSAAQVVPLLDRRTALLEYLIDPAGASLFVVTSDGLTIYRLPPMDRIDRLVADVRASLATPGRREFTKYRRAARQLYEALIVPALGVLSTRETLFVVPDGSLHYLPFEILLTSPSKAAADDPRALPYLLRRWSVSYAPSASVLATLRERAAEQNSSSSDGRRPTLVAVAVGSPRGGFKPLPHARREIEAIARAFGDTEVSIVTDEQAGEEKLKGHALLERARYLHFATHAVTDERQPTRAGLVLSAGPSSREDGVLRTAEIYNSRVTADLVVLSACHTALGREVRGEGIMGLSRAFLYAGAQSLVVSLWQVTDESTADLMAAFYARLTRSGKVDALRQAKLTLVDGGEWSHPYYWAPFVLQGAAR